ncbi:MAG TPA: lysylphosphatidylglycerol synthase transmembrane domain-containing protein [Polyangia bacterium]|nr:lysylphosphatidylglycerol synthase transmembrane domain-containing protein [Polyangia bacterium]
MRWAVTALVVVLLGRLAVQQDWRRVWGVMRGARLGLLLVVVGLNVPLIWCKARRLHLLLRPTLRVPIGRLMRFFVVSYAADNLVMSHAGLGVRVALLRREGAPWSTAVAVQGLEKAMEAMGIALVALVVQLSPSLSTLPTWIGRPLRWSFVLSGAAMVGAMALLVAGAMGQGLLRRFGEAATALRRPEVALETSLWTATAWAIEVVMVTLGLRALDLPAGLMGSCLVLLAVTLGSLIPGLPGNFGTFEASAVVALGVLGVEPAVALGWALLYHFLHTIPVTVVGLPQLRMATYRAPLASSRGAEAEATHPAA